ncbi:MAG: hypothetical protein ABS46_17895 [Cytophagaceae bacterium SCN 52-12]|nr:MAG: hypothetical protein ABS46_17895 [Cytophagaceae bacterium SCN 52-12]
MSEKVTFETLKKYATEFCAITLAKAYSSKDTLSGHDLLKLTPVRKINQHIVARLSAHWNSQLQHFNSPYFDFNSDEVKTALEHFSNVVSQHIALKREHLQPWLQDIVEKTLAPLAGAGVMSESDEDLVRQFSSVHPLVIEIQRKEAAATAPGSAKSVSFFNIVEEEAEETKQALPTAAVAEEKQEQQADKKEEAPKAAAAPQAGRPESLNSRFKVELPDYSGDLNYGSVKVKLENIGQSISLAQRFMFVGQLFKGDFEAFSHSVQTLDSAPDWDTAHAYITQNLAGKYGWDLKNEAVTELIALTKRKFS